MVFPTTTVQPGREPRARAGVHSAYESDSAGAACCLARVWRRQALSRRRTLCQGLTRVHPRALFRADRHARLSADDASVSRLANLSAWSHGVEGCCRGSHDASILSFCRAVPSSDAVRTAFARSPRRVSRRKTFWRCSLAKSRASAALAVASPGLWAASRTHKRRWRAFCASWMYGGNVKWSGARRTGPDRVAP